MLNSAGSLSNAPAPAGALYLASSSAALAGILRPAGVYIGERRLAQGVAARDSINLSARRCPIDIGRADAEAGHNEIMRRNVDAPHRAATQLRPRKSEMKRHMRGFELIEDGVFDLEMNVEVRLTGK